MVKLKGHVGRVDKFLICGWALNEEDPTATTKVDIIQAGKTVVTLYPGFPAPTLRAALSLPEYDGPHMYQWRLWLPLSNGLKPEIPFTIAFQETGQPLTLGQDRHLSVVENFHRDARKGIEEALLMFPLISMDDGSLRFRIKAALPCGDYETQLFVGNQEVFACASRAVDHTLFFKPTQTYVFSLPLEDILCAEANEFRISLRVNPGGPRRQWNLHDSLRTIFIPKSLVDPTLLLADIPDESNIHRVSGPTSSQLHYLIGGLTTFRQMNMILESHFEKSIFDYENVLDWGVGCGRVVRHFWESRLPAEAELKTPRILGLDIDELNVRWCQANLEGFGTYAVLSPSGFALSDGSFDLLYGISVMTHLSEYHQHQWLKEIRRILRPGGVAILTVHGEAVYGRIPDQIPLPFVERFGFFDGIPDNAIGEDRSSYYRATYHSREYIEQYWSQYFEIIDIVIAGHAFSQDFVVLRRPV